MGFVLVDVSFSRSQEERLFYTFHLQMENTDSYYKMNFEALREKMLYRHRQGQRTDTWQHVTSLDHFCGARIPLYNSKKRKDAVRDM
ncbi:hypothetical protein YC2023_110834 [Brassica napus]